MKIIRAVKRYIESAEIECKILRFLREKDPNDEQGIVTLVESFPYYDNFVLIFEPLGLSLYEILKISNYRGFNL